MKPVNISLIGMPGSGKTAIGQMAAKQCNLSFTDTDEIIEAAYGAIEALFQKGEAHFRALETLAVKQAAAMDHTVIATGGGSVLRTENMAALKARGRIVYIDRPLQSIISDINDAHRPLIKGKSHVLVELYTGRKALYEKYADFTLVNDQTVEKAAEDLARYIHEVL